MLEIGQSNYVRAIGRRGQTRMHWKDKRYCSHSCIAWFEFSFLLACLLTYVQYPTNVEFIALLTEPFSKETKAFKEERVAQVNCVSDGGN